MGARGRDGRRPRRAPAGGSRARPWPASASPGAGAAGLGEPEHGGSRMRRWPALAQDLAGPWRGQAPVPDGPSTGESGYGAAGPARRRWPARGGLQRRGRWLGQGRRGRPALERQAWGWPALVSRDAGGGHVGDASRGGRRVWLRAAADEQGGGRGSRARRASGAGRGAGGGCRR